MLKAVMLSTIPIILFMLYALASGMSFEDAKARESRWCDMVEAEVWGASEAEYRRRCK